RVDRLEIKKMDGTAQTVMVNDQTQYQEGRRDAQKNLQLEDLKPGDRVFVRGRASDNKELVALVVHRVTDQEMQRFGGNRTFGEITSIDGNQIKVRNPRQGDKTIVVNDQTVFIKDGQPITLKDLKAGDRVFAVGKETDGQFVADRVMTGQLRRGAARAPITTRDPGTLDPVPCVAPASCRPLLARARRTPAPAAGMAALLQLSQRLEKSEQ